MMPEDIEVRIVAASFYTKPFRGRTKLLFWAAQWGIERGQDIYGRPGFDVHGRAVSALKALEMTSQEREHAVLRGELHPDVVWALGLLHLVEEAKEVRRMRSALHYRASRWTDDPLAQRQPGETLKRMAIEAFQKAKGRFWHRRARKHEDVIVFVPEGQENVISEMTYIHPKEANIPNRGWWVGKSKHTWFISAAILRIPPAERVVEFGPIRYSRSRYYGTSSVGRSRALYLSPTVRVRHGRGTSLIVDRLEP